MTCTGFERGSHISITSAAAIGMFWGVGSVGDSEGKRNAPALPLGCRA
jgi:hypothetical protein